VEKGLYEVAEKRFPQKTRVYFNEKKDAEPNIKTRCLVTLNKAKGVLNKFNKISILKYSEDMKSAYFCIEGIPYNFSFSLKYDSYDYNKQENFA
jgi:hypothetical protein